MTNNIDEHEFEEREIETRDITINKMSPAIVQAMYNEILESNESLAKTFQPGKIITRQDVRNFCERFSQAFEQYNMKGFKSEFTIRREEDHTETFSTLDRFLASDPAGGRLTAGLVVEFKFLIKPPNYEKYQEYKSTLIINSSDFTKKSEGEAFLLNMVGFPTFSFSIDYSDYSVARTFITLTEEWYNSLDTIKTSSFLDFVKKRFNPFTDNSLLTNFAALIATMMGIYSCYQLIDVYQIKDDNKNFAQFILLCTIIIYLSRYIGITSMNLAVKNIGKYRKPNFIILNKIDENNKIKYETERNKIISGMLISIIGASLTIILNLISNWLYSFLM